MLTTQQVACIMQESSFCNFPFWFDGYQNGAILEKIADWSETMHIDEILTQGKAVDIPWEKFTFCVNDRN